MFETIRTLIQYGSLLAIGCLVLLALPQCKLREFLTPIAGWVFAALCGAYVLMPVDLVPEAIAGPFGLVDDVAAVLAGIASVKAARKASQGSRSFSRN